MQYLSKVFDPTLQKEVEQELPLIIYEAPNAKKLVLRLPWMSDSPYADENNPLLQEFVKKSLKNNTSVVIVAAPWTGWKGYIEQRTLKILKQNFVDALIILKSKISNYSELKKYLIGRSVGWTLVGGLIDTDDFEGFAIIAGRLKTKELYDEVIDTPEEYPPIQNKNNTFYGFGWLRSYIRAGITTKTSKWKKVYCQNSYYLNELLTEQKEIEKAFETVSEKTNKPSLLILQASDDTTVPYSQFDQRIELAQKNKLPVQSVTIKTKCWHRFEEPEAIKTTNETLQKFIN